jgi:hypothetical protein
VIRLQRRGLTVGLSPSGSCCTLANRGGGLLVLDEAALRWLLTTAIPAALAELRQSAVGATPLSSDPSKWRGGP